MDELIILKQVDVTQLLIYFYILPYFHHSKMITIIVLLLQCIRQKGLLSSVEARESEVSLSKLMKMNKKYCTRATTH